MRKGFVGALVAIASSLLIFGTQSSCEKDNIVNNNITDTVYRCPPSIKGLWEGTMTDAITQPFFLSVKSNGTSTSENISPGTQKNLSYGTWNLSGSTFTTTLVCKYGYPTNLDLNMDFTGTYDSLLGKIVGTFHLESPSGATGDGTFQLSRVN